MHHLNFLRSMYATHAPYWVAAVGLALALRSARVALESVALSLREEAER